VRAVHLRLVLALDAVALGAAGALLVLGAGLPAAARGALSPASVVAIAIAVAVAVTLAGAVLLVRQVGRPVDRVLSAAGALEAGAGDLPLLGAPGDAGGRGLSGAAVAFERLAAALAAERARLAQKVAELERADEALVRAERLATAGRLASGIAHEVGNPLGAITGYAELARDRLAAGEAGRADAEDFLRRIAVEAQRIDRIVRGLLDLARPAAPALSAVDVTAPIEAALRLARVQPRFRAIEVDVAVPPDLPSISADEGRLAQVFLNLFLNAADAMGGTGRVRIAARVREGRVEVDVRDGGPGIPPADLARVFEPFFSTKAAGEGTGLGLAISQGIVESFGGELGAANAPEGGAVLTVALPVARAGTSAAAC
jgi:two-component system NtrC family sensor kinase